MLKTHKQKGQNTNMDKKTKYSQISLYTLFIIKPKTRPPCISDTLYLKHIHIIIKMKADFNKNRHSKCQKENIQYKKYLAFFMYQNYTSIVPGHHNHAIKTPT